MANPDIYLLFGVARGGAVGGDSEKQIRSDLEDIINKINDDKLLKVKIGLDEKSVEGMKDSLESGLNLKGKKIAVKTELDTAAIKGIQKQVGDMLTKLGETAAQSETHLKGIVDLLSEINSKPFSASLNFSDANTGVETLGRYREAVRDYVREMRDGYDAIAKIASHPLWKSSGLEDTFRGQIGSLYGSDFEKAIPKFEKRLDASSSLAGVERVAKDALVYWQQLLPILTKAQEIGIISAESKFGIIPEIPQESVGVASQLADLFTQISQRAQEAATASKPVTDEMTQALEGERQAADALSDEYNEHVSAVKAAAEAELLKAQQSAELASALGNEQKALDGVEDAASGEGKNVGKNVGLYHEYLDLITKIENALHRTGGVVEYSGEAYDKLTAHLVELKGHLKDGQESTEEFSTALKNAGYNSEQALGEAKTALKEYNLEVADAKLNSEGFENATKELKNSFTLYKQMNDLAGKMRVAIGKGAINNSDLEQYKELETAYSRLANIIYECEGDVEKFGSAVKAAGYDGSVEIKRAQAAMASYNRVLNENARAGRDAADKNKEAAQSIEKSQKIYQQFVSILTRMRSALNGGETTMASSAYYAALNEQWLKLSGIISGCSGNAQEFGEYIKEAGIDAEQTISEAATSLAEYKLALENMKPAIKAVAKEEERAAHDKADAERTATEAAKQRNKEQQAAASLNIKTERLYYSQLNAVRTMLLRVQNDLSRYSAAKTGRASGAYRELENQVEALKSMQGALISSGKPLDNFQKLMGSVRVNTKGASDAIVAARENTKSFADRFSGLASKFSMWFSATRVIMAVVRSIRQMVSASVELDSALTQMQIVTKANTDEMEKFAQSASQSAKEIGSSISDFISSATTFARLGYDAEESSILARYTAMLQNVGDIDVSDAQDAITAIVKVFDVKMDDIESIMDRLVTVGNNFPISVSEIAEGMNNVSSAMHAAGNDFNQTVALLTAANTSVQNISKASTGLRTIAARIRNMKTELDDLGEAMTDAEYDKLVQALTDASVSLTDQQGNLRSTYDILADIAAVWDSIDPNKQAAIAETLSGTRQQNVYDSIIGQFQEATGAMEAMGKNSAGALQEAYEVFLNSIQGHLNQFKAAFESLSRSAAEGDFIKSIIDIGIKLIEILSSVSTLTNRIGGLNTALYTTASIIAVIKAEAIVTRLQRVADWFRAITTYVAQLKTVYKSFHSGQALVVQGTNNFSAALKGLGITASAAQLSVAGLAAAIGGLLIVINLVRQAQEKAQQQKVEAARAEAEAAEKAEENASNILGLYSAYQTAEKGTKDFRDASLELAKALNEEVSDGVTGVTEDLNELSEAALRAAHTSAITARDLAGSALVGEVSGRFTFGKQSNNLYNLADELPLHFTSNQKLNDLIKTTLYENRRDLSTAQGVSDYYKDLLSIKELIETINEEAGGESGFLDTKLYKSVTFALDDLKAEYEEYDTAVSREVRSDAMQYMFSVLRSGIIKTEDDFARWRQNVILASGKSIEFKKVLLELSADAFPDLVSEVEQTAGEIDDLYQRLTVLSENANNMDEALDGVVKAVQNFGDGTKEVYDAMKALEEKFPGSTAKLYDFETATLLVEAGLIADKASLLDFVDSNRQLEFSSAISELEKLADGYWGVAGAALAAMNAEAQAQMSRVIGFTTATTPSSSYDNYKNKLIAAIQSEKDEWDAWISGLRKRPDYTPKDTSSTKSEKEVDLELEWLKSIVALRKEELSFLEASGDSTENQVAKMREIQKSLHDQAEHMRGVLSTMVAQGATQAEINAQEESILSLSTEWWKIQNDINELLHDDVDTLSVYKDRISLLKAELDFMEARGDADSDRILKMREIQAALHEEAEAIRATEAYTKGEASALQSVVELGTEWWNLQNKIKELSEETLTNEKELLDNMKSGMDKVLSLVIELIKKQKDDEVQALEDQKTAYRQIIDLRKKALDQSKTEAKYQKDIAKQLESMAELQRKINSLDLDDSREAQNEKAKLLKELEGLQESLAETQADHAIDAQEESLDKMQDAFEEEKDSEIKVVKDSISSYQKLYDQAISYISENWSTLYDDLIAWNTTYGSELNSAVTSAWDECLKAAERYGSYVEALNHIDNDITNADTKSSSGTQRTVASYVSEMKQNSNEWNRRYNEGVAAGRDPAELRRELNNSDEIKRLHARNIEIMNILRGDPYNLPIEYDEAHGKYYIVENGVRNELYTKYPQYHSGGIVEGRPSAKQDEVLALLKNGETVLTERQGEAMYRIVDIFATLGDKLGKFIDGSRVKSIFASPMPQARFASAIDAINANGSGGTTIEHMEITAPIYVSEKLDEEDIRRHARTIGATAAEYIREGFTKRNVTGPVFGM